MITLESLQTQINTIQLSIDSILANLKDTSLIVPSGQTGDITFADFFGKEYGTKVNPLTGNLTLDLSNSKLASGTWAMYRGNANPVISIVNNTTPPASVVFNNSISSQGDYPMLMWYILGDVYIQFLGSSGGAIIENAPTNIVLTEGVI